MKPIIRYGWQIYFHPLFFRQWEDLLHRVKTLKQTLPAEKFVTHPEAKLLKAIDRGNEASPLQAAGYQNQKRRSC